MRTVIGKPLLLSFLAAVVAVLSGDARDVEHFYWNPWFRYTSVSAPDDALIVSLDDGLLSVDNSAAGSTAKQAELLHRLDELGVGRIYLDTPKAAGADAEGDAALYRALTRLGDRVTLVERQTRDAGAMAPGDQFPVSGFRPPTVTPLAASLWYTNVFHVPIDAAPAVERNGKLIPAVALAASGSLSMDGKFYANYRLNPDTIVTVNSRDVLRGPEAAFPFSHRDVYLTRTGSGSETLVSSFGHGRIPQAKIDIASAEALNHGKPGHLAGHPFLVLFLCMVTVAGLVRRRSCKLVMYSGLAVALLLGPGLLVNANVVTDIGSAMVAVLVYIPLRLWEKWRRGVQLTSSASGLPNVDALVADGMPAGSDVVAGCVSNFEQMLVSLPRELHGECSRQIARRLSVAFGGSTIYDNGDGHFVWLVQPFSTEELVAQLEGLKALFASPLVIGKHVLDTNIHFGLDRNGANKPVNRVKSAIASSSEAVSKLKLYEEYGSERLAETPWELSLHARIDDALRNGDIWLAFQPQLDLRNQRISGAEALIRWTDPERGPIPPGTFILQAERAGRIDTITYWVLEQAALAARELNRDFAPFRISVNLSARIVDQPGLIANVLAITDRAGIDSSLLKFEVTETFDMANREVAKENLAALRALGFSLSIDDFGTGYASLAYLSEIPTDEIKLDRCFIGTLCDSIRDQAIVENVIRLGHAMGQEVVGEGVEDRRTLELLRALHCDTVQGYLIGRPVRLPELARVLTEQDGRLTAYG